MPSSAKLTQHAKSPFANTFESMPSNVKLRHGGICNAQTFRPHSPGSPEASRLRASVMLRPLPCAAQRVDGLPASAPALQGSDAAQTSGEWRCHSPAQKLQKRRRSPRPAADVALLSQSTVASNLLTHDVP